MKNKLRIVSMLSSFLAISVLAGTSAFAEGSVTVALPSGGSVDIVLDQYVNPDRNAGNKTLVAVHGIVHTGATFAPLANELFKKKGVDKVARVIAINFPGRNGSSLPFDENGDLIPGAFGNLTITDYTAVLLEVLSQLSESLKVESLFGHSMGALIIQTAQDALVAQGSSLQKAYGVKDVYLLSSSIPSPLSWAFADSGAAGGALSGLISYDPNLGMYLHVLRANPFEQYYIYMQWVSLFFTNLSGQVVANVPSFETVMASGYLANEPLIMLLQLLGANGFERPFVNQGVFANQKCLRVISASQDLAVPGEDLLQENQNLYVHLTGDASLKNFTQIPGADAVHDMYLSNPSRVAAEINSCKKK